MAQRVESTLTHFSNPLASTEVGFNLARMATRPNPEGDPVGSLTDEELWDGFNVGKPG